ncbi:MAG TPA: hypothetical protein VMW76_04430 [Bacteroidales bacterium]|nr:hypothetical protein [Bacteroidales bacterium]
MKNSIYFFSLLLAFVACTSSTENGNSTESKLHDWEYYSNVFYLSKSQGAVRLGVKYFENDSIDFRLLAKDNKCELEYQSIAINPGNELGVGVYDDEDGSAYFVNNFIVSNDDVYIDIGIDFEQTKIQIIFVDNTNTIECIPDLSGILREK